MATNVAEAAVTVPGVRYVIDSGVVKLRVFDARLVAESVRRVPVSQSSALQRAGRAGREAHGKGKPFIVLLLVWLSKRNLQLLFE